jgi:GNAT superfamily N-acetyltransferase
MKASSPPSGTSAENLDGAVIARLGPTDLGAWIGLIELSERSCAEGCDSSPVGYVEGIWVAPRARRGGIARQLVEAAVAWAQERGHTERASDAPLQKRASQAMRLSLGFEETDRIVCNRRQLDRGSDGSSEAGVSARPGRLRQGDCPAAEHDGSTLA